MRLSRRQFSLAAAGAGASAALAGCGGGGGTTTASASRAAPTITPVASPAFDAWLAGFRTRALSRGLSQSALQTGLRGVGYLPDVLEKDGTQFQTRRTLEDYVALATSDDRLRQGREMLTRHRQTLAAIAARYGVEPTTVTAIWGLESRYGTRRGDYPVISALATLGFRSRRAKFFEGQLVAALKILAQGNTTPERMLGSWAGAMGHTQFIPTTYLSYAVDFTGDGRRDIWAEDPSDALASAANYLAKSGWTAGLPWGLEVTLPAGVSAPKSHKGASRRSFADWSRAGLRRPGGGDLPTKGSAALVRPGGSVGPALLITSNFNTILRYNNAAKYAVAIGHLSDRLGGQGAFAAGFGTDEFGLTLAQRKELQARLAAKGYDVGSVDGVLGAKTEAAIRAFQRSARLPETGRPSAALLARLG